MNEERGFPRGDFIASVLLIALSSWIAFLSLTMRRFGDLGLAASPGLSPLIFSILLLMCGLILFRRACVKRGYRLELSREKIVRFLRALETRHFLVVLASIVAYYVLLGRAHFVLISSAYVAFTIWYFKGVAWWRNLLVSVLVVTAIWYSFDQIFLIPLP